jgi:hypothetical protein
MSGVRTRDRVQKGTSKVLAGRDEELGELGSLRGTAPATKVALRGSSGGKWYRRCVSGRGTLRGCFHRAVMAVGGCALLLTACGSPSSHRPLDAGQEVPADAAGREAPADRSMDGAQTPDKLPAVDGGHPDTREADGRMDVLSTGDVATSDGSIDRGSAASQDAGIQQCGTLANSASPVTATLVTSISRNFVGGATTDGIYELVRAEETVSSAPAKFWRTFQIRKSGSEFEWAIQDVGLPPDHHFAGSLTAMGHNLVMTDCMGETLTYPYDAPGPELTLYFLIGQTGGRIFHYRLRP